MTPSSRRSGLTSPAIVSSADRYVGRATAGGVADPSTRTGPSASETSRLHVGHVGGGAERARRELQLDGEGEGEHDADDPHHEIGPPQEAVLPADPRGGAQLDFLRGCKWMRDGHVTIMRGCKWMRERRTVRASLPSTYARYLTTRSHLGAKSVCRPQEILRHGLIIDRVGVVASLLRTRWVVEARIAGQTPAVGDGHSVGAHLEAWKWLRGYYGGYYVGTHLEAWKWLRGYYGGYYGYSGSYNAAGVGGYLDVGVNLGVELSEIGPRRGALWRAVGREAHEGVRG